MSMTSSGRSRLGTGAFDGIDGDDGLAGAGGRDHDVGRGERLVEPLEAHRRRTDPLGECRAAFGRPVDHADVGAAGLVQSHRDALAHRPGADDGDATLGQVADDVGEHLDRGMAHRGGAASDRGFAPRPLAGLDGRTHQQVEPRAGRRFVERDLPGRTDLSEDLALAEHRRVEPGRDFEQMPDGGAVVLAEQVRAQLVDVEFAEFAQEVPDVGIRAVEALGDDVHLGAIARRQHDRLTDVVPLRQARHTPWPGRRPRS